MKNQKLKTNLEITLFVILLFVPSALAVIFESSPYIEIIYIGSFLGVLGFLLFMFRNR